MLEMKKRRMSRVRISVCDDAPRKAASVSTNDTQRTGLPRVEHRPQHQPFLRKLRKRLGQRTVSSFDYNLLDLDEQAVGDMLKERPADRPLEISASR